MTVYKKEEYTVERLTTARQIRDAYRLVIEDLAQSSYGLGDDKKEADVVTTMTVLGEIEHSRTTSLYGLALLTPREEQ